MAILNNSNAISAGGYDVNNSLRFRQSASARLSRTPGTAGNRKTWTFSAWVKIGIFTPAGAQQGLFSARSTSTDQMTVFYQDEKISFQSGGSKGSITTNAVLRDPSAWYHLVVVLDATNATAADRAIIYLNGTRQTVTTATSFTNADHGINATIAHNIGAEAGTNTLFFDGYMAEINFIDGSAKAVSDFGATDATTGVWQPKAYTGTYGTNGFYLKFSDIATTSGSNAGLGKDFSGNTNYWTTNNISVTSGTTYDAMKDSPTNTSATVANYCVANPLDNRGLTISGGNLNLSLATATWYSMRASMAFPSTGKYYWEYTVNDAGYNIVGILDANGSIAANEYIYSTQYGYAWQSVSAAKGNNNSTSAYGSATTTGDVLMIAFDADNRSLFVGKNGTWFNSSNPATNTSPMYSSIPTTLTFFPAFAQYSTASSAINFGQRAFSYTPPTGYVALNTYNLPTPTILQGNKYMDATLYTGTGSSLSVTNAGSFQPDLVWIKSRSNAQDHKLTDVVRGTTKSLESNTTDAEATDTNGLTAFGSSGFTVGTDATYNTNTYTYVGWQWKAGNSAGSSNTSGSITSTVSVNTTAGFSIGTFTSPASGTCSVGHGLGVKPSMTIVKCRSVGNSGWFVWHQALGDNNTDYLSLQSTAAEASFSTMWGTVGRTSTLLGFTQGGSLEANATHVFYAWAEITGFSKFGSYTGNGSADGPFVFTNFRPKFVIVKRTDSTGDWYVIDSSRATYNQIGPGLNPNTSSAEFTLGSPTGGALDFLSNGFKWRGTYVDMNASGGTYIFMAFAENPFKNANAR